MLNPSEFGCHQSDTAPRRLAAVLGPSKTTCTTPRLQTRGPQPRTPATNLPPALVAYPYSRIIYLECTMCNRQGPSCCSVCQESIYCSVECQNKDWPAHRLLCHSSKNFNTSNPLPCPDKNRSYKRGILFRAHADAPSRVWLKYNNPYGYDDNAGDFLGDDKPMQSRSTVQKNLVQGKQLSNTIDVIYRDEFGNDGSRQNRTILAATSAQGGVKFNWRGNVVAMMRLGSSPLSTVVVDMGLSAFRDVVDHFTTYTGGTGEDFVARPGANHAILTQIIPLASLTTVYTENTS
jgi:hypothetical protein